MSEFLTVVSPAEAHARFAQVYTPRPLGSERVAIRDAYRRVLAADVVAPEDLPEFDKSTVDGFAVRSADTAAAAANGAVRLRLRGEVEMGEAPGFALAPGQTARIPTGGMLPEGADAVVMLEQSVRIEPATVDLRRRAAPGENVIHRAEDVRGGQTVLARGTRLRPQDLGLLAGIGAVEVGVFLRPRVAVVATGDEIIPSHGRPSAGQVRDINTYTLGALVEQEGGAPQIWEIVPDDRNHLLRTLQAARRSADLVLVSGGSSVGEKDAVGWAINAMGKPGVVVHGVNIKPGKPTILGVVDGTPLIGLPGHPVSGMIIFDVFVRDLLRRLAGCAPAKRFGRAVAARMARRVAPAGGREEHVRVLLEERDGEVWAVPQAAKSGIITSMTRAEGVVVVPAGQDGLAEGAAVEVRLFDP